MKPYPVSFSELPLGAERLRFDAPQYPADLIYSAVDRVIEAMEREARAVDEFWRTLFSAKKK
jgi:hypothetical protein